MGVDGHASAIKFDGYVFVTIVGYSHPGSTISLREFIIYLDIAARYSGYVCPALLREKG